MPCGGEGRRDWIKAGWRRVSVFGIIRFMKNKRMDQVADHFQTEARGFDARVIRIVPYYREMLDALVNSLPFPPAKPIRVLDLGCGTGTVAYVVKSRFPRAAVHCVDLVPRMLELAAKKLRGFSGVSFEQADFSRYRIAGKYDAVVTSLALHHLETDADKAAMHRKIYRALVPGGVFASADITVSPRPFLQRYYLNQWAAFILRSLPQRELDANYRRYRLEDRPSVLLPELRRLERTGFRHVEILWKRYNFATYAAYK